MIAIGAPAVKPLAEKLEDYSYTYVIKDILARMDREAQTELLLCLQQVQDGKSIGPLLDSIGQLKPEGAREAVSPLLKHDDPLIRSKAEWTLSRLGMSHAELRELKEW